MKSCDTPCKFCPYRKDVPSGVWDRSEYEKLPEYDRPTLEQPPTVFACHNEPDNACTGWLWNAINAFPGFQSLGLRMAAALGVPVEIDPEFEPTVPMFETGREACEHGVRDIDDPDEDAQVAAEVLSKVIERRKNH